MRLKKFFGFTLIELVISIAVLSIIAAVLAPIIIQSIDLFLMTRVQEELAHEAGFALSWMSEEIKTKCISITAISANSITFNTNDSNISINYLWDTNAKQLIRTAEGSAGQDILAQRVRFFEFRGFAPGDFNISAGTTILADIKVVQMRVMVEDSTGTKAYELATRIMPRYLPR
ncbi:MAG: type II secretion system protein [Candidatus Omnitrophota bacterium]